MGTEVSRRLRGTLCGFLLKEKALYSGTCPRGNPPGTDSQSGTEVMSETALPPKKKATRAGNYFISNYPPFSFWSDEQGAEVQAAFESSPVPGTPLGLYHHIPFCRKRCHFCYFRVYTDKNAQDIRDYLDHTICELEKIVWDETESSVERSASTRSRRSRHSSSVASVECSKGGVLGKLASKLSRILSAKSSDASSTAAAEGDGLLLVLDPRHTRLGAGGELFCGHL
mgnify:CR=1 FL=1